MMHAEWVLAEILRSGSRALAGYAASEPPPPEATASHAALQPQFDGWQNVLAARIEELAVAVATGRPEYFVQQVRWARAALAARGVAPEALRANLESLCRVLKGQLPDQLAPMAAAYIDRALAECDGEPDGLSPRLGAHTPSERLAATYLLAILEGDRRRASDLLLRAADEGRTVRDLYLEVLQPAQVELGRMWLLGEINIAEEHFATATTRSVMALLHARAPCKPGNGKTLVAAAIAGNQHDLGIQAVADLFEQDGWRAIQLGASVPAEDLAQAVEFYAADLVALSVSLGTQWTSLVDTIALIRSTARGAAVKILVGGGGIYGNEDLVRSAGADCYASNAAEAVARGNALLSGASSPVSD